MVASLDCDAEVHDSEGSNDLVDSNDSVDPAAIR